MAIQHLFYYTELSCAQDSLHRLRIAVEGFKKIKKIKKMLVSRIAVEGSIQHLFYSTELSCAQDSLHRVEK
jgi:hypothetical protein